MYYIGPNLLSPFGKTLFCCLYMLTYISFCWNYYSSMLSLLDDTYSHVNGLTTSINLMIATHSTINLAFALPIVSVHVLASAKAAVPTHLSDL